MLTFISTVLFSSALIAKENPILEGMWEITTKFDFSAIKETMKDLPKEAQEVLKENMSNGDMVMRQCLKDFNLIEDFYTVEDDCTLKTISKTDRKWAYELNCSDPVTKKLIELTPSQDKKSFTVKVKLVITENGQNMVSTINQEGKWLHASCE